MGNAVYANGREIGHKGKAGAPIAVFPDVCLTPPEVPAGPTPIPYPNLAMSEGSRTGIASKTVKVKGKDVVSASKSTFKKTAGDEAGTRGMAGGVVSSTSMDKMQWSAGTSKVHAKGKNAVVHLAGSPARGGPAAIRSPAARKGVTVGTGAATQEPAAGVNAPPPIACGNPNCPHHTARVPATQTAQLPAEKVQEHGLLSPVVCLECYRKFSGLEPKPAAG